MMDYELRVGSYQRSHNARIAHIVRNMTPEQRQHALDKIHAMTLLRDPDEEEMKRVMKLLRKEEEK